MVWEENSRICLHMQLIAILSRIGVIIAKQTDAEATDRLSAIVWFLWLSDYHRFIFYLIIPSVFTASPHTWSLQFCSHIETFLHVSRAWRAVKTLFIGKEQPRNDILSSSNRVGEPPLASSHLLCSCWMYVHSPRRLLWQKYQLHPNPFCFNLIVSSLRLIISACRSIHRCCHRRLLLLQKCLNTL